VLGFFLGILPGGGAVVSSFASYALEKRLSKTPERFGKGAIEGVAGPEAANNAAAGGAFIPLMTLGIPPNVVMALLLGAFIIHGLQPGPLMITQNPELFWGIVASMYIGNVMLLILNLPLIGMWVKLLKLPYNVLFPLILLFTIIGVYASGNLFDVYVMIWLRRDRLSDAQVRLRAGAAGAGLRARADAGEQPAQGADPVAGRPG
jgi:putative tricarboxylic transport membrane protein